jgi:hypothetical protein
MHRQLYLIPSITLFATHVADVIVVQVGNTRLIVGKEVVAHE